MSGKPLRILVVENREDDAELMMERLRRDGFEPIWRRVDTPEALLAALRDEPWHMVLCDFVMPRFSGADALRIFKEEGLDLPFIIVSGSIEDEAAVESMKAGAHDFFRKDKLARLAAAIDRELREAQVRRERARATAALQEVQELHRRTLESIKDYAIFASDLEGRVTTWNPGVERVLGYPGPSFIGLPFARLFTPEDLEAGLPGRELARAQEDERFDGEEWRVRQDGTRIWVEVSLTPLLDEAGTPRGYAHVVRDISERKRLIDELRVAVQARDEFLSIASHELRTPLTSLRLQLQSMEPLVAGVVRKVPDAARLASKLSAVLRHTGRIKDLVEALLDVSRIKSGRLELRRESLDVTEVVREVVSHLEAVRAASETELRIHAPGGAIMGEFDRLRLEAVVTNLLSNALKFGRGQPVDIVVGQDEDTVCLAVRDTGIGINPENHSRIFERFERAVPESHYGGFGVGLWIVRRVVEAHGGSVQVESRVGCGTTVRVVLPRRARP